MKITPLNINKILNRYHLTPSKGLGQNFLIDETVLKKIIEVARIEKQDEVLEIGSGLGSLTRLLALSAKRVVAVELDERFIPPLEDILKPFNNIEMINADILEIDVGSFFKKPGYLVVANIPYYITSAILRHLLEGDKAPRRLVLTVQKEVGDRICSLPGEMSILALSVQVYGKPAIKARIPAKAFYPSPKVDSVVVTVDLFPKPCIPKEDIDMFFLLVKAGFSQKRKTIRNALAGGMRWKKEEVDDILQKIGLDKNRRAQTLEISDWISLVKEVNQK